MDTYIYENIRKIREMKNLTRDYVAAELEMSTSGYGKIERGEVDLTISKLFKISKTFRISITDLLFFNPELFFQTQLNNEGTADTINHRDYLERNKRIIFLERENFLLKKK